MKIGFTIGKFAPLHKGHQYLIEKGIKEMDEFYVIIYETNVIKIPVQQRAKWIKELYPNVHILLAKNPPSQYGLDEKSIKIQMEYLKNIIKDIPVTHFYNSETYGKFVARDLQIEEVQVDRQRQKYAISGTIIRNNMKENKKFVEDIVYKELDIEKGEDMNFSRNTYLEVDVEKIRNNIKKIIHNYKGYTYYFGVVKANCYGCDDEQLQLTKVISESGCNYLAVATLEEALKIRKVIKEIPILVLGYVPAKFIECAKEENITLTIISKEYLQEIVRYNCQNLKIHIKVNTGMNRLGVSKKQDLKEIYDKCKINNIDVEGIYTHIYHAKSREDYLEQIDRFKDITSLIDISKIKIVHISASEALTKYPKQPYINGCRLGIIMYGFTEEKELQLESPIKLISEIIQIHELEKGEVVGYNGLFEAKEKTRIAVIPIGYADGIIRKNIGRTVYIKDKPYPIVGNICMDMLFVKIDNSVNLYDKVYLLKDNAHIEEVANYLDTIAYEILTEISSRVNKKMKTYENKQKLDEKEQT